MVRGIPTKVGNLVNPEKPVEIIDINTRKRKHGRRNHLHQKLAAIAHPHQVVGYTDDVQQRQPLTKKSNSHTS